MKVRRMRIRRMRLPVLELNGTRTSKAETESKQQKTQSTTPQSPKKTTRTKQNKHLESNQRNYEKVKRSYPLLQQKKGMVQMHEIQLEKNKGSNSVKSCNTSIEHSGGPGCIVLLWSDIHHQAILRPVVSPVTQRVTALSLSGVCATSSN